MYIRSLFEANRGVQDPRAQRVRDHIPTIVGISLTLERRLFSKKPRTSLRNGSIPIRTFHLVHQEVGLYHHRARRVNTC